MGLLSMKDFEGLNVDLSSLDTFQSLVFISGFLVDNDMTLKQDSSKMEKEKGASGSSTKDSNLEEAEKEFEKAEANPVAKLPASSNRERLIREKALKKTMVEEPKKKERHSCNDATKVKQSAVEYSTRKTSSLKRKCQSRDDDNEWGPSDICKKQKTMGKNKKISLEKKSKSGSGSCSPVQRPELPENFKKLIDNLGGTKVALVIQKTLKKSDLDRSSNRLSMPVNQLESINFLEDEERESLDREKTLTVQFIDPGLVQGEICLRRWTMEKKPGENGKEKKSSIVYVLRTQWGKIAARNKLREHALVQVWSFRVDGELGLALVLVRGRGGDGGHDQEIMSDGSNNESSPSGETPRSTPESTVTVAAVINDGSDNQASTSQTGNI